MKRGACRSRGSKRNLPNESCVERQIKRTLRGYRPRLQEPVDADGLLFALQLSLAQINQFFARQQAIAEIRREQNLLIKLLHHRFETENGVDHVADDGRVALRIEPDVAAGDRTKMERDPDVERLAVGPFDRTRERQDFARDLERRRAIDSLLPAAPVSEQRVADELVDRSPTLRHEVAGLAKPDAKLLREMGAGNLFRHAAESANVAD